MCDASECTELFETCSVSTESDCENGADAGDGSLSVDCSVGMLTFKCCCCDVDVDVCVV